jgi:hypothetical protein
MKKIFKYFASALLLAGFVFVSCSKDDTVNLAPEEELDTYTLTVNATKQPLTKYLDLDGTTLYAKWKVGDQVVVWKEGFGRAGFLEATTVSTDGLQATFTGGVSTSVAVGDNLVLKYHKKSDEYAPDYLKQDGTLEGISAECDFAEATVEVLSISGNTMTSTKASFESQQAIVQFNLKDEAGNDISATHIDIEVEGMTGYITVTPPNSVYGHSFYVAIPGISSKTVKLTALVSDVYTYQKSNVTFENSKFYGVNVNMFSIRRTPLTFSAKAAGTITVNLNGSPGNGVDMVKNGDTDNTVHVDPSSTGTINVAKGDKVAFYGNNTRYALSYTDYSNITCSSDCYVYGNIMSLISKTSYSSSEVYKTLTGDFAFYGLFAANTHLLSHSWKNLYLPATTLTNSCYRDMFNGCSSLTRTPTLPATTLATRCYQGMFYNCTSLAAAPNLPATTLADYCYDSMFHGCTSITTAPKLSVTTLADFCYYGMFQGCTSLATAPALPATILADYCYDRMFNGCTSLATAPALNATTLAKSCYEAMFYGCTSLAAAPALPATTLADLCYQQMFYGCTSLTTAPSVLPATTLTKQCYTEMFRNCTKLTAAPSLPATTLAQSCYARMFMDCQLLATAPSLPATTMEHNCYYYMFANCYALTAAPALSSENLASNCYEGMFWNCQFETAPALPATTLAPYCYKTMFMGNPNLTAAPDLPAATLVSECYNEMFAYCTKLSSIKCLATDISAYNCTKNWLQTVKSSGTFIKAPSMTSWSTGVNGIPSGWTVNDAS